MAYFLLNNRLNRQRGGYSSQSFRLEQLDMPASGQEGCYFPYNSDLNGYDSSSFHSSFFDDVVTHPDVALLVNEINALHDTPVPSTAWIAILIVPLVLLLPAGIVFMALNLQTNRYVCTNGRCGYETQGIFPVAFFAPMIILLVFTVIGLIFSVVYCSNSRNQRNAARRQISINTVINKHLSTTFRGKNVLVRLSPMGSYLAIEPKKSSLAGGVTGIAGLSGIGLSPMQIPTTFVQPVFISQPQSHPQAPQDNFDGSFYRDFSYQQPGVQPSSKNTNYPQPPPGTSI